MVTQVTPGLQQVQQELRAAGEPLQEQIDALVQRFLLQPTTPQGALEFETALRELLREVGRVTLEVVFNHLEADDPQQMPKQVEHEGHDYSRKNEKTRHRQGIGTLFGSIELWRYSYEPLREGREQGCRSISPLEMSLGIVAGNATPALAERVGRAASGQTQQELRELLRREHHIHWSVEVLRNVTAAVSQGIGEHLHAAQKARLLSWLKQADASRGRHKITLAAGRDGIMLPIRGEPTYKEGAVATVSVYDRRGRRLGTVYLGQMPEAHQATLSEQLTRLLQEVLAEWEGHWPRLAYITDAGHHPTEYYDNVLVSLPHPRRPGHPMDWIRVVDYYHACEYIAKLADVLLDDARARHAWQRRMRQVLKREANAVFRILHSAARLHRDRFLGEKAEAAYQRAYGYLLRQQKYLAYSEYRRLGLPIGSGVTEAACKTVFTQRFKESGMSWSLDGGHTILTLRLAQLSGVWASVYDNYLSHRAAPILATHPSNSRPPCIKAA